MIKQKIMETSKMETTDIRQVERLLRAQVENYVPANEQEERDRNLLLRWIDSGTDILTRDNEVAHLTASAWVMNPDRTKVLMAYHNLYDSWAWLGGHADGDKDLLRVAMKEVREESGIQRGKAHQQYQTPKETIAEILAFPTLVLALDIKSKSKQQGKDSVCLSAKKGKNHIECTFIEYIQPLRRISRINGKDKMFHIVNKQYSHHGKASQSIDQFDARCFL
jgi:8-oxo-dGTP pyrophosphatase MutT (NUDIX family)